MRLLWVREPWLWLIESGAKTVEHRSRATKYRGPVVLCSSLKKPPAGEECGPLGVTRCLVEITDCAPLDRELAERAYPGHAMVDDGEFAGFGWSLRVVTSLPRVAMRGRLGLVTPTADELAALPDLRAALQGAVMARVRSAPR